jgi:tetratricopeptide (TPR) repeat protein
MAESNAPDHQIRHMDPPAIRTTDGFIALLNLRAQIDGLERQARLIGLPNDRRADLIDLISLRGQLLGLIADYERANDLAEQFVLDAPAEGMAYVSRARTRGTFHRFEESLADLDRAEQLGTDPSSLVSERASALCETGQAERALALIQAAADRSPDVSTLGTLAVLYAECGELAVADATFAQAATQYRGVSPFPIAMLDFQRGRMWLEQEEPNLGRLWLEAACTRLPAYAPAQGHLAQVEAEVGEYESALARLRPLATSSDDPDYTAQLARILDDTGESAEAEHWRHVTARRYDMLVNRHPAAFADHAAEFWLSAGHDPFRAVGLATQNLRCRPTRRARMLLQRALDQATRCRRGPASDGY